MNLYVAVALLVVAPCCLGEGQTCQGQADCASDECCAYFAPYRGRRADSGVCKKRGTLNDKCFTENRFQTEGRYANICPCASGFGCLSMGFVEVPFGEVGQCRPLATDVRRAMHCNTGADCPDDHCCQSLNQLDGRRQLLSQGVCQPMGKAGSSCHVRYQAGKPKDMVYSCPCSQGLHCQGSGFFDIPLGEMGTCTANTKGRREEVESRETHCATGADCPPDQCCESLFKPIGRRQFISRAQGVCRPMGTVGSHCYANSVSGKPDHMAMSCPCSTGLNCKGSGFFEVPMGEVGTCQAAATTRRALQSRDTNCTSGADCPADQCCVHVFTSHVDGQHAAGVCRPLGHENSPCFSKVAPGKHDGIELGACPCSEGLHCWPHLMGAIDLPHIGRSGHCIVNKQAREEQSDDVGCETGADCPSDQCCVSLMRPIGRRQLHGGKVCRPMGTAGSSCFANSKSGKPDHAVFACPCSTGFHCQPNGIFDIPLGELGQCQPETSDVRRALPVGCNTGADCPDDHCCVSMYQPGGRRQVFTHGVCEPMAKAGSSCLVRYQAGKPKDMVYQCPCSQGLHCQGSGMMDMPLGEMGTCVAPQAADEQSDDVSCQTGADCPSDQCCVDLNRPIGRRQLHDGKVCRPMGTAGSSCLAKSKPGKPDNVVFACPCTKGFHCKPNGIFDVPLGELGNCEADSH